MTDAPPDPRPDPPPDDDAARRVVPARRSARAVGVFLAVTLGVLAADLGLKAWSFEHVAARPVRLVAMDVRDHAMFWAFHGHEPVVVVPRVLNLQLTTNTGAVFGLGKGNRGVFIAVSAVALVVIGVLFARSPAGAWGLHVGLALILAGALGNLYDRVRFAAVRDMLHMLPGVHLPFGLAWPGSAPPGGAGGEGVTEVWPWIFNLADVSLLAGVGLVLILTWWTEAKRGQTTAAP